MANEQVVDELVVKLTQDNREYKQADREKNKLVDATEAKERKVDTERNKRAKSRARDDSAQKRASNEQQKRLGQTERAVKSLASTLKGFALTSAAVFGIGAGVGGIVGAITNLAGFESGLRRAAVSTGMSNKEMQAWGATAKRLGADADAGAAAIAQLAREQKQFNLTGSAPTMQALQRSLGININAQTAPADALEAAQQAYRRASPAQQQQMEASLSAQGVSDDLIVMIKSETDAREAYTRSLADSTDEDKKSMAALNDAMTSVKQASIKLAAVIATAATPYIQQFSNWVHDVASDPSRVQAWLANVASALKTTAHAVQIMGRAANDAFNVLKRIAHPIANASNGINDWLHKGTKDFDTSDGHTPFGLFARRALHSIGIGNNPDLNEGSKAPDYLNGTTPQPWDPSNGDTTPATTTPKAPGGAVSSQDFMQQLIAHGATPAQAMAMTANALREAPGSTPGTIDPAAVNPNGGASGAFQWLGDRKAAFKAQYGVDPAQASLSDQLDFLFSNPTEVARMNQSFARGGSVADLGRNFSKIFEAHGNVAEDIRRGQLAQQLSNNMDNGGADNSTSITITGPVTVKANDPQELVGGIIRIASVQNYQTANR